MTRPTSALALLAPAFLAVAVAPAAQHSVTPYGFGVPGTGGVTPTIWVDGEPRLGNLGFQLTLKGGLGGAAAALALSDGRAAIGFGSGVLLLDPLSSLFTVVGPIALSGPAGAAGAGAAHQVVGIPGLPALEGLDLFAQWFVVDPPSPAGGFALSDALRITVRRDARLLSALSSGLESLSLAGASAIQPWPTGVISGVDLAVTRDGRTAAALLFDFPFGPRLEFYDVTAAPPTPFAGRSIADASAVGLHPSVDLAYVVTSGGTGSGALSIVDLDRESPTFGQVTGSVAGVSLPSGFVAISADGRRLMVREFFTGFGVVDVEPGSPTRNTLLTRYPGFSATATPALAADGGSYFLREDDDSIGQYDIETGVRIARTAPLAAPPGAITVDPRGRFLVVATGAALTVVDVEPGAGFFATRTIETGGPVSGIALPADSRTAIVSMGAQYEVYDLATGVGFGAVSSMEQVGAFVLR
ncbi:MAG: hypothetical protein AAF628_07900 [Planctomycetota bacterium]